MYIKFTYAALIIAFFSLSILAAYALRIALLRMALYRQAASLPDGSGWQLEEIYQGLLRVTFRLHIMLRDPTLGTTVAFALERSSFQKDELRLLFQHPAAGGNELLRHASGPTWKMFVNEFQTKIDFVRGEYVEITLPPKLSRTASLAQLQAMVVALWNELSCEVDGGTEKHSSFYRYPVELLSVRDIRRQLLSTRFYAGFLVCFSFAVFSVAVAIFLLRFVWP